jgi:hypothetical protein
VGTLCKSHSFFANLMVEYVERMKYALCIHQNLLRKQVGLVQYAQWVHLAIRRSLHISLPQSLWYNSPTVSIISRKEYAMAGDNRPLTSMVACAG